jgi:hypothetical protein
MFAFLVVLAVLMQAGPVSNGTDFGSCLGPDNRPIDIRRVMLLQNRELVLDSGAGPARFVLEGQRIHLHHPERRDNFMVVDVGDSSFRQGLFTISPDALSTDRKQVLTPLCEGKGGIDHSH